MVLSLKYENLWNTVSESNRLADELGQYCDDLSRKVQQKMYSVEGGMSSALNNADYYVNQKIQQLRTREANARTLSAKSQILLETAKRVDADVEKTIQANQKEFFNKNPQMKAPWYQQAFTSFMCDMKKIPVIGWLIKNGEQAAGALDTLIKDIRYWYKCEGGKELVGIVLSTVGAVLAVVAFVCALALTGGTIPEVIVGVVGLIGNIIGLVNAVTNIVTSFQAYNEATGGHPGRAKIYAEQDKLSDVLRQRNFHNKEWNRSSNAWAAGIEITDTICSVITFVSGATKTLQKLKKINITKTFQAICQPRNALGRFTQGKPTLWNGLKSIALKFNIKDFVFGDLNVKNLSRISKLKKADKIEVIGELAEAAKTFVDDLDEINEGKQSFSEFLAKRVVIGFDKTFLKQQVLRTEVDKDGVKVRKFRDNNFSTIIKAIRIPIDGLGLGKVITDTEHSGTLSNVLNMKGGLKKNITDIVKQIKLWLPPKSRIDSSTNKMISIENSFSARGYFDRLNVIHTTPTMDLNIEICKPSFTMPALNLDFRFECVYPYYNVKVA